MSVESLRELFALRLPDHHLVSAEPLSGGLSNRCWKVIIKHTETGQSHTLVWRPDSSSSQAFGVSRQHEYDVLHAIHTSSLPDLAPRAFAHFTEGLLVEWAKGQTADTDFPLSYLVALQSAVHQLPLPYWRLDVQQRGAHYWQFMGDEKGNNQLQRIHTYFQSQPIRKWFEDTCCHHDLGWYNIIIALDGQQKVIDWEYAAAGDPSLDLALTIAANQLDPIKAVDLYCQQMGICDADTRALWHSAVEYWHPWCDYLAMLWFYAGAKQFAGQEPFNEDYFNEAQSLKEKLWNRLQFSD